MAAKGAKETLVNRLGFKSSSKAVEMEIEKLKKENTQLKKNVEDMKRAGRHHHTHPDSDRAKLLERILALETGRERSSQQLLRQEQEISTLRQQLRSAHGEVVSSLQSQLELKQQEAQQRETQFQALSKETEDLKNKYCAISERCETLEKQKVSSGDLATVQEQLRDALDKNQHWLVYDQQREAFVQAVLARTKELETQLNEANQALQQQQPKEANSDGQSGQAAQRELEAERARLSRLQAEVEDLRGRCEEKSREAAQVREQLLEERKQEWEARQHLTQRNARLQAEMEDERARLGRLQAEVEDLRGQYEEKSREAAQAREQLLEERKQEQSERKRSAQRNAQLQAELEDERKRSAELLMQIHLSAKEAENEKLDRPTLQHQLHKVLKELRKARDQIARLESAKQQRESRFSEPSSYNRIDLERLTIQDRTTSPSKVHNILDESLLECPNCGASYPTSQHRELLAHLDYCFS